MGFLGSHKSTLSAFLLLFCRAHGLLVRCETPVIRSSVCSMQLTPSDVASLLPVDESILEGVSWKDAALYGVLPLLSLAYFSTRPPARLLSDQQLDQLVQGTNLQGRDKVQCLYKASRDGWSATDFHACVDNVGSAVVAAKALGIGQVFGGYNPAGWRSTDDYVTSTAAFLWATKGSGVQQFPILPGGNAAVFDYATSGPNFGAGDLQLGPSQAAVLGGFAGPDTEDISTSAGNLRQAKSVAGVTYDVTADWPARGKLVLTEVEVYGKPL